VNAKPLVSLADMSDSNRVANKRKHFSLNEKNYIVKQIDSGKKQAAVAKELGIAPTTVSTILKGREKMFEEFIGADSDLETEPSLTHGAVLEGFILPGGKIRSD
jgi:DNA-binding CsgD family transcriptional regulator